MAAKTRKEINSISKEPDDGPQICPKLLEVD